jgi:alpha-glucosidase
LNSPETREFLRPNSAGIHWRAPFGEVVLVIIGALAIRILAVSIYWQPGIISGEGAEYARIAENLRSGLRYSGIATPGLELMFPPLFPLLIALASLVTHDYEWAGRFVTIVLGAALPLPIYGVASYLFGRSAGLTAALIAALHPLFINLSIAVLTEGPYATLLFSGVYAALRAMERSTTRHWCLVGGTFGLAYLVRQEAIGPLLVAAIFALVATPGTRALKCKHAAAALGMFLVLALPEIAFIFKTTGLLRLEAKTPINYAIGSRMLGGQDQRLAEFAINDNLEGTGVWMVSNLSIVRDTRPDLKSLLRFFKRATLKNTPSLLSYVSSPWFGSPLLPALALLGAFHRPWRREIVLRHLFIVLTGSTAIIATFTVFHAIQARNYFVLVLFAALYAANGLMILARWTRETVDELALGGLRSGVMVGLVLISTLAGAAFYGYTTYHVRRDTGLNEESADNIDIKDTAVWIRRQQSRRVKIMDLGTSLAFHADADYVHYPYSSAGDALRFIAAAHVDYLILRRNTAFTDYYADWVAHGVPDPRAMFVYASTGADPGSFVVFQWTNTKTQEASKQRDPIEKEVGDKSRTTQFLHVSAATGKVTSIDAEGHQWWQHAVFYEIYPRSFADHNNDGIGDLNGISSRLDYLRWLGVDAIWLTPMFPSPQVDFGYDISDFENIDPTYGSLRDLDRLISEARRRNIRIILDFVMNHTSDRHPWFIESASSRTNPKREWYVWRDSVLGNRPPNNWLSEFGGPAWKFDSRTKQWYYHSFYPEQPDLNWRNPAVQAAMFDVTHWWYQRGIAGFRLDAVDALLEDSELRDNPIMDKRKNAFGDPIEREVYNTKLPAVHEILQRLRRVADESNAVLIGETWILSVNELKAYYGENGNELQMPMDLLFTTVDKLSASKFRHQIADVEAAGIWPVFVLSSHDIPRAYNRYGDGRHNDQIAKLMAAMYLTLRGTPIMYYGEEIGMENNDPTRREDVKDPLGKLGWPKEKGRDGERTPMQWDTTANAGFSKVAPWNAVGPRFPFYNVAVEQKDADSILNFYRRLLTLRRTNLALREGTYTPLDEDDLNVLGYVRSYKGLNVLVLLNMSSTTQTVHPSVSLKSATTLLTSSDRSRQNRPGEFDLEPFSVYIAELH